MPLDIYGDLLPPLSTEEFEALRADVKENGVLHPVFVDEDGNVLDGRHRLKIDPQAKRKVIRGLTPAEKEAFVFRANFVRRNLSPAQKDEAERKMAKVGKALREEDKRKWTNKRVAEALGLSTDKVERWFRATNPQMRNGSKRAPDARVKVNPSKKPDIAAAVKSGKTHEQVAADIGVSRQAITKIVREETKKAEVKQQREEAAKKRDGNCGVIHGDFRVGMLGQEDESIDLIVTDPPYDELSAKLYGELAAIALPKLVKGGWLLAYSGQNHLPQIFASMSIAGLNYGWTFCVLHSGGDLRFRKFKLQNGWKPVVGFYRPPLQVDWEWFKDVVSGGKEKDDHEWQQSEAEAAHFIERLCPKHGLVVDPFCGSGTTLAAAKRLERKWLGFEINEEHVETARNRLQ